VADVQPAAFAGRLVGVVAELPGVVVGDRVLDDDADRVRLLCVVRTARRQGGDQVRVP
jgi:hypothetical protein